MHGEFMAVERVLHPTHSRNSHSHSDNGGASLAPTPGPGRVTSRDQDLILRLAAAMDSRDVNPRRIAAAMFQQNPLVQANLAEMCFHLIGLWAEMGEFSSPTHPLANEYANARKMVSNLFL